MAVAAAGIALTVVVASGWHPSGAAAARTSATILGPTASSLDPAVQSDAGSAQVVSQLFESLTAVDSAEHVQPALAASWETANGGKQVVFHLRSGLKFSDGSSLTAKDVVNSWMRLLGPAHPSQLASLLDGVVGAKAYRQGKGAASGVGIKAPNDTQVQVTLTSPEADFPAIVSGPTLAVVPRGHRHEPERARTGHLRRQRRLRTERPHSRPRRRSRPTPTTGLASPPSPRSICSSELPSGQSAVTAFQAGSLDYTPVSAGDATWIAYDKTLGPSLRIEPSPSVEYYGFNTTKPPFDNVHVRRAFELGIDWKRIVNLLGNPLVVPATGMVPAGVPGHSTTDYGPKFDLAAAKSELAAAGYANGAGFPHITLVTAGAALDAAIVAQVHKNLGIDISYQALDWPIYNQTLLSDPPAFWEMDWVADYPGANDFLGHPARRRPDQQLRPLEQPGLRDRAQRGPFRRRRHGKSGGLRQGPVDRVGPGARDPGRLRRGLRSGGQGSARGTAQTARAWSATPASHGRPEHEDLRCRFPGARRAAGLAVAAAVTLVLVGPAQVAAASVTFGTPTASSKFGTGITFTQPYSGGGFAQAEIAISLPGDVGPSITAIEKPGASSLSYALDTSSGGLTPFTPVTAHFQVVLADGTVLAGPEVHVTYADDRFSWKSVTGGLVTIHWFQGPDSFAQQLLSYGQKGLAKSAQFLGVTETKPINFYVYPSQAAFAQGLSVPETIGGQAEPDLSRLLRLDRPHGPGVWQQRGPARADPHRLLGHRRQPIPLAATLAERGSGRLSLRGLRRGQSSAGQPGRKWRNSRAAGRPRRLLRARSGPDLPLLRRGRVGG